VLAVDAGPSAWPAPGEENPFLRFRDFLTCGGDDALVRRLDDAVAAVDGHGFRTTPLKIVDGIAAKDETGNVAGSHKARHLFGVLLHLERRGVPREARLAIASCGNAALAAAVLARAAGRPLDVFIPPSANRAVVERLEALGAHLTICPRAPGVPGDPCVQRFREAVREGAVPFCCQGPDNGFTVEGGMTLALELVDQLDQPLDRLYIQTGGGALAASCVQALRHAVRLGRIPRLPRIHAVQTMGCAPLARAFDLLSAGKVSITDAARRRGELMWPWEEEPHSAADGILDDETYDWLVIAEGMLESGGSPVVVDEATLREANRWARDKAGVAASVTGSAGLAGLLAMRGEVPAKERCGVILSGVRR
jgi:threonine synthase